MKLINDDRRKIFENSIFQMKVVTYLVSFLNTVWNLQQLRMFFNDFFNLVVVFKDIEPSY